MFAPVPLKLRSALAGGVLTKLENWFRKKAFTNYRVITGSSELLPTPISVDCAHKQSTARKGRIWRTFIGLWGPGVPDNSVSNPAAHGKFRCY